MINNESIKELSRAITHVNCKLTSLSLRINNIDDVGRELLNEAQEHENCKARNLKIDF